MAEKANILANFFEKCNILSQFQVKNSKKWKIYLKNATFCLVLFSPKMKDFRKNVNFQTFEK